MYPAKLIVDGKLVRDEFPDWGDVLHRSRTTDFAHIDKHFSFDQPNMSQNTCELQTRDQLYTNTMGTAVSGNSTGARDYLNMHQGRVDINDSIFSAKSTESFESTHEMECNVQTQENQTTHRPLITEINSDLPSGSDSSNSVIIHEALIHVTNSVHDDDKHSVSSSQEIFRPFDIDNTITNVQNSEQKQQNHAFRERMSRPAVRVDRRKASLSVSRSRASRDTNTEKPGQSKNRPAGSKTHQSENVNMSPSRRDSDFSQQKQGATSGASGENATSEQLSS